MPLNIFPQNFKTSLSAEVLALVELTPVEDLLLALFEDALPGVSVQTLIADDQSFPFVLLRADGGYGQSNGDMRLIDSAQVETHAFTRGVNADSDSALLSEAVRVILRDSKNKVVPGKGHITKVAMVGRPKKVADYATATGPVQYADLPTGVVRYQTSYNVQIKKPSARPFPLT